MDTAFWPYLAKRGTFLVIEDLVCQCQDRPEQVVQHRVDAAAGSNGKLSGLGERAGINHIITFYNKDWVMDAWGKEPTDDWTMDDYVECMAACVKKKGEGFFGGNGPIGGDHVCDGWVAQLGWLLHGRRGQEVALCRRKSAVTGLQVATRPDQERQLPWP